MPTTFVHNTNAFIFRRCINPMELYRSYMHVQLVAFYPIAAILFSGDYIGRKGS